MGMDSGASPSLDEVRRYHLGRLNDAVRRPGVWGGETTLRLFLDAVAFVDGRSADWQQEQDALRERGAFTALGVRGAFARVLPGHDDDGAVGSVYAEVAWRLGWLTIDRVVPADEHRRLRVETDWCARDRDLDEVLDEFGPPSVLCGGGNPRFSKTVVYAAADRTCGLVSLHFAGTYDWESPQPQPESPPALVAVRHGNEPFLDTFAFTPTGQGIAGIE
ncbi:hypothetical protein ACQPZJ_18860 [Actinoplanes sp. CA-054009]